MTKYQNITQPKVISHKDNDLILSDVMRNHNAPQLDVRDLVRMFTWQHFIYLEIKDLYILFNFYQFLLNILINNVGLIR